MGRVRQGGDFAMKAGLCVVDEYSRKRLGRLLVASVLAIAVLSLYGCGPSIESLQRSGDVAALAAIAEKSTQYEQQEQAVAAIGEIGTPQAIRQLAEWVDARGAMWSFAIAALGKTGAPEAVDVLAAQIDGLDAQASAYRTELALLCTAVSTLDDPRIAKALLKHVDRADYLGATPSELAVGLAGQGQDVVPQLVQRLAQKNDSIYRPCAIALFDMNARHPSAVRRLLAAKKTSRIWIGIFERGEEVQFKPDLIGSLKTGGSANLASAMVNSDDSELQNAGRTWAKKHGYRIEEITTYGFDK